MGLHWAGVIMGWGVNYQIWDKNGSAVILCGSMGPSHCACSSKEMQALVMGMDLGSRHGTGTVGTPSPALPVSHPRRAGGTARR